MDTEKPAQTEQPGAGAPAASSPVETPKPDVPSGEPGKETPASPASDAGRDVTTTPPAKPKTELLDAVRKAIEKPEAAKPDARSPSSGDAGPAVRDPSGRFTAKPKDGQGAVPAQPKPKPDDGDPSKDDYLSREEMAALNPRAQKRINQLWRERQEARETLTGFERDVKPRADQWEKLTGFLDSHGMSNDEAAEILIIGALLKSDPAKAWEQMKPHIERVQAFLGHTLPEDLRREVDDGVISEERAKEIVALRNRQSFDATRSRETAEQQRARTAKERHDATTREVNDATVGREHAVAATDPDYWTVKAPLMEGEMARLLNMRGLPRNGDEAVKMFDEAMINVNKHLGLLRDKVAPRRTATPAKPNGRSSATERAAPSNPYEAARAAIERHRLQGT